MGDSSRFSTATSGRITEPEEASTEALRRRLAEAEETIRAISRGEVDAVVVNGPKGPQVYTLEGADHPYRILVEQMHEGTVTLDRDQLILYANPQFAAMMETASDALVGSDFKRLLPPVDSNVFSSLVEAAALSRHSSGDLHLRAVTDSAVPVRVSLTPLDVAGMQTLCIVAIDLREQRRNEAIVKEEQLSRLILEQAGEAIVVIDLLGRIVRRSESAGGLSGQPTLSDSFDQAFQLSTADSPLQARHILELASAGEHIRGLEAVMFHPDGRRSSLLVSASPLWSQPSLSQPPLSQPSDFLGCVITLTDISERKRVEEALTRQADELARSNSDLRQFAYSASHDLREPLRQMALFSELLQQRCKESMDEEAVRLAQYTIDSARRMEALLSDLQAYTRAADAPEGVTGPSDANDAVRKTLAVFEAQIAECGARVDCEPLPVLNVHEVYLTQLFQNLIGNALKYRGEQPLVIRISAQPMEGMWMLSVGDNGIGIDPDYQRQIFGLFQRLHGGTKYSGSGIGLAICQKIVQRHGGRIWVESEPGQGSRFIFTLPGGNYDAP